MSKLYNKCSQELKRYELDEESFKMLNEQLVNVCSELNHEEENDTAQDIISELFSLNDINPELKKKFEGETHIHNYTNIKDKSAYQKFTSEQFNELHLLNKWGGLELDLRHFEFPLGDLKIDITNTYGGIVIYLNPNTEVSHFMQNTFGGVETANYNVPNNPEHKITIIGKNKMAGIEFVSTDEIEHLRKYYNKAAYKAEKKRQKNYQETKEDINE